MQHRHQQPTPSDPLAQDTARPMIPRVEIASLVTLRNATLDADIACDLEWQNVCAAITAHEEAAAYRDAMQRQLTDLLRDFGITEEELP